MMLVNKAKLLPIMGAKLPKSAPIKLTDDLENIVVSYDQNGVVVSKASDLIWNMTSYNPHKIKTNLHFVYWTFDRKLTKSDIAPSRLERIKELQQLICTILFTTNGSDLGVKRLVQYHVSIRKMAVYAEELGTGIFEILAKPSMLEQFLRSLPLNTFCNVMRVLRLLYTRKKAEVHFDVAILESWDELYKIEQEYYATTKQHVPLPTRIYSDLIINLDEELNFIAHHLPEILNDLQTVLADWRNGSYDKSGKLKNTPSLSLLINRYGRTQNLVGIGSALKYIFVVCKLNLHLFSGMRRQEVDFLPFHCLKTEGGNGRKIALIVGTTTKLNKGKKLRTEWVTTIENGHRAVKITQAVSGFIYEALGVKPSRAESDKDNFRLFISTDYLPWRSRCNLDRSGKTPFGITNGTQIQDYGIECLATRLIPIIQDADVEELHDIDPFTDWAHEDDYQVGKKWPLSTHQLRRSLALYARSSGIVRNSSLRRQLQHISNDMSNYYSNGSAFAKSLFDQDIKVFNNHILKEWQDTKDEAEVLSFIWDVLKSDEALHGGAGHFYFSQMKNGQPITREEIEAAVKAGTLAYRSSPIGGCTKPDSCEDNTGLSLMNVACATKGCKHLVGKHSKLVQAIEVRKAQLRHTDIDSIEFKAEEEEIKALSELELLWRPKLIDTNLEGV